MRHYEIVFLVHPDQSDQTSSIISKLSALVTESGGKVHRSENIGNRKLSYPIQDHFKASYGLLNIECNQEAIDEIKNSFKFNDSVIRDLILNSKKAQTESSALLSQTKEESEKESYEEEKQKKYQAEKVAKEEQQQARSKERAVASAETTDDKKIQSEESTSSTELKDEPSTDTTDTTEK